MSQSVESYQDLRYETKFFIENIGADLIKEYVQAHKGSFVKTYPDRYINNLYFDNDLLQSYSDNVDGCEKRVKSRMRWFGDVDDIITPTLEFKIKDGKLNSKRRFQIFEKLLSSSSLYEITSKIKGSIPLKFKVAFEQFMRPTVITRYYRSYFESLDSGIRLTIDRELEFYDQLGSVQFNSSRKVSVENVVVVELKGPKEKQEEIQSIINNLPFKVTKSSKYITGINLSPFRG